jgi:L-alanine-DL-glutamate epimerase-like enolase superfamily enzyme
MVERRDMLRAAGTFAAASAVSVPSAMAQASAINKAGTGALKITKIEPFIIRYPKDTVAESDVVHMAPIGATNEGAGLWKRLDFHSPCRFHGHQQTLLVKVTTNQGIVGWGEAHAVAAPRSHHAEITDLLSPILIGQDARDIDVLWERMRTSQRLRGYSTGSFLESIAAIDIALWDVVGKYLNTPVYRLLGGKYRDEIPTYIWINGTSIDGLKEQAAKAISDGYTVLKMSLSQDVQEHPGSSNFERVIAVSEAINGKAQVIVDSLGTFKLYEATKIGHDLDRLGNIGWWEDPLMPEDDSGHVELARAIDTPVCKGEGLHNRTQMRDLCAARAMDISNLDVAKSGGISETKKMALIADLYNIMWSPHVSIGSVPYIAASIHLAVATPNCLILENQNQINGPLGNILLKEPIEYRPGYAKVPDRPGLGIEIDEAQLAKVTIG